MADSDGQVVIDLSLRKDGIQSDIEWLKSNLRNLGADVNAEQISDKFENAMNKAKQSVDKAVENINDKKAKPKISADDSGLKEKTEESTEKIEKLNGKHAKAKISANNTNLYEKVSESREELDKIPKNKRTTITVSDEASEPTKKIGGSFKESAEKSKSFTESLKGTAVGMGIYQTAMAAGAMVSNQFAGAISRYDTLNNFPRILQSMGASAKDANASMQILKQGVDGLPTSLDDVAKVSERLLPISKNAQDASRSALALNDAFLASGASSEDASRGLVQYTQMLSSGKVDLQSWKTLEETMPASLKKVSESFGIAGGNVQMLYKKVQSGQITMKQLNQRFQDLDKGANGFHQEALNATGGIGTAFQNMGNRIKASLQEAIGGFDKMIQAMTGKSIAGNINSMTSKFSKFGKEAGKAMADFGEKIKPIMPMIKPLIPAITTFAGVLTGLTVATAVASGLAKVVGALGSFANPVVLAVSAISALVVGFTQLYKHNAKFKSFVDGIVKNISSLVKNISKVAKTITKDFVGAFNNLASPIKKAFSNIMKYISPDLKKLQKSFSSSMKTIQKAWSSGWKTIQKVFQPIMKGISKFVQQHMKQISSIIKSDIKIISTIWNTTWKQIQNVFKLVWDMIFHKSRVADDVKRIITTAVKATKTIWKNVWNAIKNYFDIIWDAIKNIARSAIKWVSHIIESTIRTIKNTWNKIWSSIKDFIGNIWGGIKKTVSNAINAVHDTISSVLDKIGDVWHSMWNSVSDFFKGIWKDIKHAAEEGINGVLRVINAGIDGIDAVWKFFTGHETSIHHLKPVHFSQGGIVDRHLSMVNDGDGADWKELIETPDGDLMMSNERNAVLPLEPGTRVYNGSETRQIMSMLGVDHYANGGVVGGIQHYKDGGVVGDIINWGAHELKDFGSWIKDKWDAITKFLKHPIENTKAIISKAITAPLGKLSNSNMVDLGKGVFDKLTKPIADWFKKGLQQAKDEHDSQSANLDSNSTSPKATGDHKHWVEQAGIPMKYWDDVNYIVSHESGWNPHATNPSSGAYGLPQSLPAGKMAAAGKDWRDNPITQLKWMYSYVNSAYGGFPQAHAFWLTHHAYDNGGVIDKKELAWLAENNREFVINPQRDSADELLKEAAEERYAFNPNSEIAKAISGMNVARANNGAVLPNSTRLSNVSNVTSVNTPANENNGNNVNIAVELDGRTIANASYPFQKALQANEIRMQTRKGGGVFA